MSFFIISIFISVFMLSILNGKLLDSVPEPPIIAKSDFIISLLEVININTAF